MMKILVSNDDGFQAMGIVTLANCLAEIAAITVVAPDRNRSAASNSLTLDAPLRVQQAENKFYYVNGTPTDCVHLAITGLLDHEPDMIVAGINAGANLGDDVLYSGTVAAATEGRFMGLPAIAVSLVGDTLCHYETAAQVVLQLVRRMQHKRLSADMLLNINVPDVPYDELTGMEVTRLGHRHKAEPTIKETDPRGHPIYWVGPPGAEQDAGPGTDFYAIAQRRVSITPLSVDLTRYDLLGQLSEWLNT